MGYVYLIRNKVNGKGYVGKTERTIAGRFAAHVSEALSGSSRPICWAMREHGVENFSVEELFSFENDHLADHEMTFIRTYGTLAPGGYNVKPGGDGPRLKTSDVKEISVKMGSVIKELRKERGLTQKDLGELTGRFDGPFVSRLESGHVEPSLGTIAVLARALGVTLSAFFEGLG